MISNSYFNAVGVAHPCILRTMSTGATIVIGDEVGMSGATICASERVTIGDRCLLGADCMIVDNDFHTFGGAGEIPAKPVLIGSDVFVGAGAKVLKGVTVGDGAVIAAGSVVTRNVAAGSTVAGVPAREVRRSAARDEF